MKKRAALLLVPYLALGGAARAQDGQTTTDEPAPHDAPSQLDKEEPFATKPGYVQLFATVFFGDGLRFNDPYRLSTPLGSSAESVSRTASFVDIGLAATLGNPLGLQHGLALRTSIAAEGVGQVTMTPSYLAWRRWRALAVHGRAGVPLVLTPEITWGLEAAGGATFFFLGGFGACAEIVGDVFWGTGTRDTRVTTYPVLSGMFGLVAAYEVLP
jgi:hypothetical protein